MILYMPERVSSGDENSKISAIDGINGRDSVNEMVCIPTCYTE